MGIKINTTFPGVVLPKNVSYQEQLLALPGLTHWWQSGTGEALVSGKLETWTDKVAAAVAYMTDEPKRPLHVNGVMNGNPVVRYDGTSDLTTLTVAGNTSFSGNFTLVLIFKSNSPSSANTYIASSWSSLNVGTYVELQPDGDIMFKHGTGHVTTKLDAGKASILIGASSTENLAARYNGRDVGSATHNNGYSSANLVIGSLINSAYTGGWAGDLAEVLVFNRDVLLNSLDTALIEQYAHDIYGVTLG
jgi:hypothetical protein